MTTTADWIRIKAIFNELAGADTEVRERRLPELCGNDPELMRELSSLLDADDRASGFIAQPAVAGVLPMPETIGAFRVVRELGRGGMGVVYLGEREGEFRQRAAIKVINAGLSDAAHVLRRFRTEREILARLEHQNIARLLDGGSTAAGLPYFAMEYVEGTPIDRYCRERGLPLRERLELFLGVCDAVQFAHQNLVIHRDLKPGNILITDGGVPKLLDFGIARVTDESLEGDRTATEFRAMTPEYASPEQILGQPLATTSDVYSLGLVLFEILTGSRARTFTSKSPAEIARIVAETAPERPSIAANATDPGVVRALRGDLDNIVQKALRTEPSRRYASVAELAEDIRRHLGGLPVTARPDTLGYRAAKFVRRNRIAVAAAVLVVLAMTAGTAAAWWQAIEARNAQQRAERRFAQLRKLAGSMIGLDEEIAAVAGTTKAREKLVSTALEYLDSLAAEADDRTLAVETALGYIRIAEIQGNTYNANLGQIPAAMRSYAKAKRILEPLATLHPRDRQILESLARTYTGEADIEFDRNELVRAEGLYRRAIALWERVEALAPLDLQQSRSYALVLSRRGDVLGNAGYANLGRADEALALYRKSLALRERMLAANPRDERVARDVAEGVSKVAYLANNNGQFELAVQMNRRVVSLMEKIVAANPHSGNDRHDLSFAYMASAFPLRELGRLGEATETLGKSASLMEKLAAEDRANVTYRRNISVINNHLTATLIDDGRADEALKASQRATQIARELRDSDPENKTAALDYVIALRRMTEVRLALGQYAEVERVGGEAIALAEELAAGGNQRAAFEAAVLEGRIGYAIARAGRANEGERRLVNAVARFEQLVKAGSNDVRTRDELALAALYLGTTAQDAARRCGAYSLAARTWGAMDDEKQLPSRSRRNLELAREGAAACPK